jgi:hypothetical protein
VKHIVQSIRALNTFKDEINKDQLEIVGAYYPFVSGKIDLIKN